MGHILHYCCGGKKSHPRHKAAFGMGYPDLGETCERCWGCIFFDICYITGLYWWLGIFETCNVIQPNQANPCCWGLHRFFLGLTDTGTFKKKIRFPFCLFSNTSFFETSFYTIWFYIGLFPGGSTRMFEVRLFWSRLGYLNTRKQKSFMTFKEVIAVKGRLLSQSLHWLVNKDPIKKLLSNSQLPA